MHMLLLPTRQNIYLLNHFLEGHLHYDDVFSIFVQVLTKLSTTFSPPSQLSGLKEKFTNVHDLFYWDKEDK